jgi:hypothetical protein
MLSSSPRSCYAHEVIEKGAKVCAVEFIDPEAEMRHLIRWTFFEI